MISIDVSERFNPLIRIPFLKDPNKPMKIPDILPETEKEKYRYNEGKKRSLVRRKRLKEIKNKK